MSWGRLDDKLHEHPKVWRAGTSAMGLWVLANSWCCDNRWTGGFIPERVLRRWNDASCDASDASDALVCAGLWHPAEQKGEQGYVFHDWDEYGADQGQSFAAHVRWHSNKNVVKEGCDWCAQDAPHMQRNADAMPPVPVPVPEPVPTTERTTSSLARAKRSETPERFEEFWDAYDHKQGRKKAEAAYRAALKKPGVTDDLLITAASSYVAFVKAEGKHPTYTKHPTTWLNGEHWNDERTARTQPQTRVQGHLALAQKLADEHPHLRQIGPA